MTQKDVNKQRVMGFIQINFEVEEFEMEDWPMLPGGTLLKGKDGGSILLWADILSNSIYYSVNGDKAVKVMMPALEELREKGIFQDE